MESEYARIPITISGKSLQLRKRKEELEYDLDLIEKHISRAQSIRWVYSPLHDKCLFTLLLI